MSEQNKNVAKGHNIKNLKPRKGGHFKQGYFDASDKYVGARPVIYRSGLELKVFNLFERSPGIKHWSSEPDFIVIKYMYGGKLRQYNVDVYAEYHNGVKEIIEIKPYAQTQQPEAHRYFGKEARYAKDVETYQRNIAKWEAAWKYANENNMRFKIITDMALKQFNI
ncbi:hypothetical protein MA9V1_145 [Chryseobacterium phage MA9V-1]|nr:hypothetical protein MA9V1_145 [Chryseobacterium phage MA9V-1]